MNNYYVYIHRRKDTNEVFYVGISRQEKYLRVKINTGRNGLWKNIVNKYGYYGEVIHSQLSKDEAIKIEMALIKSYGRINLKTGCLANLTDGGDGSLECFKTDEAKDKIRNYRIGKKHSEETKLKMSIAKKGKKSKQSTKDKLSDIARKRFSKKVIDKKTGMIYNSVTEAAKEIGLSRAYLSSQLLGIENKKHQLEYLVD
jgi:hypothetical protein